jgi:hypothetical protein
MRKEVATMSGLIYFIAALVVFCLVYYLIPPAAVAYVKFRGKRLVTCPETRTPVGVEVDVKHAASTAAFSRRPELRLTSCSQWPEREDCDQECLLQIRMAPRESLIRTIFKGWYQGKECVFCGDPFGEVNWFNHKPALLSPEGVTVEWQDVSTEKLPDVLATHKPVCWNCHICETFRREYSDIVVDRPYHPEEGPRPHA